MKNLFWIDMEMTGINVKKNKIIEIAVIITDIELNILDQLNEVIKTEQSYINQMDEWNTNTHTKSGLIKEIPFGKNLYEVENKLLTLIERHFPQNSIMLTGNTLVLDRLFITEYMPRLNEKLHYRVVDVSSMRAIFQSRYKVHAPRNKNHRAFDDVKAGIEELKLYLSFLDKEKIKDFINDAPKS